MASQSVLDVGCGSNPRGTVNVDLRNANFADPSRHFWRQPQQIPNFILSDALHLPFRDNKFLYVAAYAVIEHTVNPVKLVCELIRVASKEVLIECPHRFAHQSLWHKHFFNQQWFATLVDVLKARNMIQHGTVQVSYKSPHPIFTFIQLPNRITCRLWL